MRGLVWLRTDLRQIDNSALFHASRECRDGLIVLHCISKTLNAQAHFNQRQYAAQLQQLSDLQQTLAELNIPLLIKTVEHMDAIEPLILDLMQEHQLETLYFNARYDLAQRTQDRTITHALENAQLKVKHYADHLIAPPGQLLTPKDKPFTSLSAFKKAWQGFLRHSQIHPLGAVEKQAVLLPVNRSDITLPWPVQSERVSQINSLFVQLINGLVSPRQFIQSILSGEVDQWLDLLIAREFNQHIMYHFPHICNRKDFLPNMKSLPWKNDQALLSAWQNGQTGYPLIDASMRCLNQTGYLPEDLLQASALFFTKVLFMDYRLGEDHFAKTRLDYEFATNNALWQWSASTGAESVIYARIPQPSRQSEVYDSTGDFIRQYCPELSSINAVGIHDPHYHARDVVAAQGYPQPVVDYNLMRKKTIYHFKTLNKTLKSSDFVAQPLEV